MEYILFVLILILILGAIVYFNKKELEELKKDTDFKLSYISCNIKKIQEEKEQERYKKIQESLPKDFHLYHSRTLIGKISYRLEYKGETHIMCGTLDDVEKHIKFFLSITNQGHTKKHFKKETSKEGSKQTT